jgi:hypothetical protein
MRLALLLVLCTGCLLRPISTGLIAADCGITAHQVGSGQFHELNPLLGRQPSPVRLWSTCAVAGAANWEAGHLSPTARTSIWALVALVEGHAVLHNLGALP